jgi:hypothetical protein
MIEKNTNKGESKMKQIAEIRNELAGAREADQGARLTTLVDEGMDFHRAGMEGEHTTNHPGGLSRGRGKVMAKDIEIGESCYDCDLRDYNTCIIECAEQEGDCCGQWITPGKDCPGPGTYGLEIHRNRATSRIRKQMEV